MHLAVATGIFHSMVGFAWARLKDAFGKIAAAASPKGILVVVHKKSAQGDEFDLLVSTHAPETVSRLLQGPPVSLLKQLPGAMGGDCPTTPQVPTNPEPLAPLLPAQITALQLLDSHESQPRSAKSAIAAKKRRPRARSGRGLPSSRRTKEPGRCREYRAMPKSAPTSKVGIRKDGMRRLLEKY